MMDVQKMIDNMKRLPELIAESDRTEKEIYSLSSKNGEISNSLTEQALFTYEEVMERSYYSYAKKLKTAVGSERNVLPLEIKQRGADILHLINSAEHSIILLAEYFTRKSESICELLKEDDSMEIRDRLYEVCATYTDLNERSRPQPGADGLGCVINEAFEQYCRFHEKLGTRAALLRAYSEYDPDDKTARDNLKLGQAIKEVSNLEEEFRCLQREFSKTASGSQMPRAYAAETYIERCGHLKERLSSLKKERGPIRRMLNWLTGQKKTLEPDLLRSTHDEDATRNFTSGLSYLYLPQGDARRLRDTFIARADPTLSDLGNRFLKGAEIIGSMRQPTPEDKMFLKLLKQSILNDTADGYLEMKIALGDLPADYVSKTLDEIDAALDRKTGKPRKDGRR